ncbi:WS/DGAT/MGAT family O-acyltransferase [Nocardia goodfellowii]
MELISPLDAIFLLGETRRFPMHVAALQLFEIPDDAAPDFVRLLQAKLLSDKEIDPTFHKRTATILGATLPIWKQEQDVELERHVHRWAVPEPGDQGALLKLVTRLHSTLLDPQYPRWEIHLIEGLAGNRFAIYAKVHHSLTDGVAGQHVAHRALGTDPSRLDVVGPWHPSPSQLGHSAADGETGLPVVATARSTETSWLRAARSLRRDKQVMLPFRAPKSLLNVPAAGPRRCVVASYPMERIQRIRQAAGVTVNDVILAATAGALRAYLLEHSGLPAASLVAMVPVSLRSDEEETMSGGNKVSGVLCPLATDSPDPLERLRRISAAMNHSKSVHRELSRTQAIVLVSMMLSPLLVPLLRGLVARTRPPFNVIISNMRGAQQPLYYGGARLQASYPLSIPVDSQALNITLSTSAENIDFGIVGYPQRVPQMESLPLLLEKSIADLEIAVFEAPLPPISPAAGIASHAADHYH